MISSDEFVRKGQSNKETDQKTTYISNTRAFRRANHIVRNPSTDGNTMNPSKHDERNMTNKPYNYSSPSNSET